MARNKVKESEPRSFRIRTDLCKQLDEYSEKSRIPKTAILEMALEEYLKKIAPVKDEKTDL
ncbi:Ribbon-helix-helix domain-containing protein [Lachnospiraceae bacterium XBB2008]|nr:Ribbon-helix-helix domain-containing protein [Lachnospiraceae bacterium XBB2008]